MLQPGIDAQIIFGTLHRPPGPKRDADGGKHDECGNEQGQGVHVVDR